MFLIYIGILLLAVSAAYALYIQGLAEIPVNHVAIPQLWGKPQFDREPKKAGLRWFPLRGWYTDFVLVKVAKTDVSDKVKSRTPDNQEMETSIEMTYVPDMSSPDSRREYILGDEKKDIDARLKGIASERIREWSRSKVEGPRTWEEMQSAHFDAAAILYKTIVDDATKVDHWIPTSILLKHFLSPQKPLSISEVEFLECENSKRAHEKVDGILHSELSPENYEALKARVEKRRGEVKAVREGSGKNHKHSLGIAVMRINITEITALGKMALLASREAEEEQERRGEVKQLNHMESLMKQLMADPPRGPGLTKEQAMEFIFTSIEDSKGEAKWKKAVNESKFSVSPETRAMLENIAMGIAERFSGKKE